MSWRRLTLEEQEEIAKKECVKRVLSKTPWCPDVITGPTATVERNIVHCKYGIVRRINKEMLKAIVQNEKIDLEDHTYYTSCTIDPFGHITWQNERIPGRRRKEVAYSESC